MAERQHHGFLFQKKVQELYGYNDSADSYTAEWDMVIGDKLYSIKNIKIGAAVELGSLKRFFDNDSPFTMIIAWHSNNNIVGVQEVEFTKEIIKELKGQLDNKLVNEAVNTLTISNFPEGAHQKAREYFKDWKSKHKPIMGKLTITGKVDSKKQRRWQCNINKTNWISLFGEFSKNTVYKNYDFKELIW